MFSGCPEGFLSDKVTEDDAIHYIMNLMWLQSYELSAFYHYAESISAAESESESESEPETPSL
jgi:hypothetical protein